VKTSTVPQFGSDAGELTGDLHPGTWLGEVFPAERLLIIKEYCSEPSADSMDQRGDGKTIFWI
jgi:hypothetical protein